MRNLQTGHLGRLAVYQSQASILKSLALGQCTLVDGDAKAVVPAKVFGFGVHQLSLQNTLPALESEFQSGLSPLVVRAIE